jgi:hypothetical protein
LNIQLDAHHVHFLSGIGLYSLNRCNKPTENIEHFLTGAANLPQPVQQTYRSGLVYQQAYPQILGITFAHWIRFGSVFDSMLKFCSTVTFVNLCPRL